MSTGTTLKQKIYVVIFEADTFWGKVFDVSLLCLIMLSILAVMLETVEVVSQQYGDVLRGLEVFLTAIFTIEYGLRLYSAPQPKAYAKSFFGIVDLLAILPTYLSIFLTGVHYFLVLRALRLLRIFRVLKLARYVGEGELLWNAMKASRPKITVFLFAVFSTVIIFGTLMYLIEGPENGYTSIPKSVYWAVVTITTVGYGDVSPQTPVGQALAAVSMVIGYGIIAVPTGIVSVEISKATAERSFTRCCPSCLREGHAHDAQFCRHCGSDLATGQDLKVS